MILLDTNVISEALKSAPSGHVVSWLDSNFASSALSSVTIFELGAGLAMLSPGKRKDALDNAITRTVRRFGSRIYAFDAAAAQAAARLLAQARANGLPLHQIPNKLADLQIAGIASAYGLDLATRNVRDFAGLGVKLINPWE
ncbi:plasmid stability protein StbB [Bradyrhizobium sp. SSBR45G]|uniref:PIN domain-containing protein n=1 Tax=unclassified Bradyrhizobium TaxID=2631580 RepID=UPI002342B995|nr:MULTISPECIES: PIN domain-containing protein [unclassified Bradyrhizobium]GLH79440.1 plasmid stability protein StbB [Bradyrhizobium sp. SSBR45G]GLH86817.1 plasmid stability protein StbB [Bradyrhizobium sp. SSBR45R]